jgi:hypothetical protein
MHERGRDRYIKQLVEGRGTRRSADGVVGVHGSYTSALSQGQLARERDYVERVAAGRARDHRFHYLHSLPTRDWPLLAACGFDSDATLGFAEQPGFRAGTAHPYRAWDHESNAPLDLIIIPLAFMDASLDMRHLDLNPHPTRGAGAELARDVIDAVERVDGCASILWHNDRLCVGDQRVWTRLYRALIERVVAHGGRVVSARDAAIAYRMLLPAHRRFEQ